MGLFLGVVASESLESNVDSEYYAYVQRQHPYGSGYREDFMEEPFYKDTQRYLKVHDNIANVTAYENDAPADYVVEPTPGILAQRYRQNRLSQM